MRPALVFSLIALSACSTFKSEYQPAATPTSSPAMSENKAPPPPPPPPPPTFWGCKISNGEGRIFKGIGDSAYSAQESARRACEQTYRRCFVLTCESGMSATFKN